MSIKNNRISNFYKEMYSLLVYNSITGTVLNTYPDSLEHTSDSFVVVELPYAFKDLDISNFDVRTTFARISFFAKDSTYMGSRMPNIMEIERMMGAFKELLPRSLPDFSITMSRTVIPPKKASAHYHYAIVNVPIVFK